MLAKGVLLGLAIAAPVGPIGLLCIRRTLHFGPRVGFATGLGAAVADATYGLVAAFGLVAITSVMLELGPWLRLAGGLMLVYLGVAALRRRSPEPGNAPAAAGASALAAAWISGVLLTLANPATILSFLTIFAGVGLGGQAVAPGDGALLVAGVGLGSALWWLALSSGVALFRRRLGPAWLVWIDRIAGAALLLFAAYALAGVSPAGLAAAFD